MSATRMTGNAFGVLLCMMVVSIGRSDEPVQGGLKQMSDHQLVQTLAEGKADLAFAEIFKRLRKNAYSEESDLAKELLATWKATDGNKDPILKGWCFGALCLLTNHEEVVSALNVQLLEGRTRNERMQAARKLGELRDESALSCLESAVAADKGVFGDGRSIARDCIFALGCIGTNAVPSLMTIWRDEALRRDCEEVVVSAMGETRDKRFTSILIEVLSGNEEVVRDNAARALGEIGDDTAIPTLRKYQEDPNPNVRESVSQAISKIERRSGTGGLGAEPGQPLE